MRRLILTLGIVLVGLYIAEAQTSGWVMDMGDGIHYWNSWDNSGRSNVKGNDNESLAYQKKEVELDLAYSKMIANTEGIEYLLRSTAFTKKHFGDEYVHDHLVNLDFTLVDKSENWLRYYTEGSETKEDHIIDVYSEQGNIVVSLTTTDMELFIEETTKIIRHSVDHYKTTYGDGNVLHDLYGDIALKYINVSQFDDKSDMFNFVNKNNKVSTFGVIYGD